ncbi:cell division protein ZapD [Chitinibacter bivalviorum]|uniref:Cell division protein ZapD n=1 Tax=Chitinibacter bivalviorum TaxID=2739434 RepID=A0A7H9BJ57_9NEIS|nr:cell division protein ZapD [Chitinibacter bivalviorum]QLG88680.1 cell division protein ZapD [Chitinibacter bivalviorum]
MISYEFPINERIRTLLRLEELYIRTSKLVARDDALDHHMALLGIFEIMEVASRADLKSDLLQELERQRQTLAALRNNPHISEDALDLVLNEIENTHTSLLDMTGKFGQYLRENEWLMAIKQRISIPGGVCEFDLPSYHYWRKQAAERRRLDLERWLTPLLPIKNGLDIVLKLLRDSAKANNFIAKQGSFQQMSGGKVVQLLKVTLPSDLPAVPELSANRYAINIRFIVPSTSGERAKVIESDINFTLSYCNL